jgi:hypothetical protein
MAEEWSCETPHNYAPTSTLPHIQMEVKASDAFRMRRELTQRRIPVLPDSIRTSIPTDVISGYLRTVRLMDGLRRFWIWILKRGSTKAFVQRPRTK